MAAIGLALLTTMLSLAGTTWAPVDSAAPSRFVRFATSAVDGNGGCNSFSGPYKLDGAKISIGPLASTRMACEPAVMDAEAAWFTLLGNTAQVELAGTQLILKDSTGAQIAVLKKQG